MFYLFAIFVLLVAVVPSIAYPLSQYRHLQSPPSITIPVCLQVESWAGLTEVIPLPYEIDRGAFATLDLMSSQEEPLEVLVSARSRLNVSLRALNPEFTTSHACALKRFESANRKIKKSGLAFSLLPAPSKRKYGIYSLAPRI